MVDESPQNPEDPRSPGESDDPGEDRTRIIKPSQEDGWVTPPPDQWSSRSPDAGGDTMIRPPDSDQDQGPYSWERQAAKTYPGRPGQHPPDRQMYGGSGWERTGFGMQGPAAPREAVAAPPRRRPRRIVWRVFRDIIIPLAAAAALALFAQATIAKPYQIPSGSMLPTIQLQDRILTNRLIYHFHGIQRGDVVVFTPPMGIEQDTPYVKRVVGLPGDTVEIKNGQVLVNSEELVVPSADRPSYTRPAQIVPDGQLFVLGDNRNQSSDSHIWGYVPENNVIGRADLIYWPLNHFSLLGN